MRLATKEAAGLDHGSCFADIEGRSSFHENRAGDVSGGEVAFMIESRREEAVEVYGIAVAFLLERQWSHAFVHDKHSPL